MIKVAILDYGTGNIASLSSAINSLNAKAYLATNLKDIKNADALILPGVGHFGHALKNLKKNCLIKPIIEIIKEGLPTLGICLGFQILTLSSEEAKGKDGMGLLPFRTLRLKQDYPKIYKIPHIGWNLLSLKNNYSKLLKDIPEDSRLFYFCNSYGVKATKRFNGTLGEYKHEEEMVGLVEYKNIYGVQFHPEKSRKQGLQLIKNFLFQ